MDLELASAALDLDFVKIDIQDDEDTREASGPSRPVLSKLVQETSPVPLKAREYEVSIPKPPNLSLGLDIDKADGKTMLIINVKPTGIVANYNSKTTGERVRKGDRIISMNGVSGSTEQMLQSLADCSTVVCKLKRTFEFRMTIMKSRASEKLGIDVDHASGEYLSVLNVGKFSVGETVLARGESLTDREPPVPAWTPGVVKKVAEPGRNVRVDVLFKDFDSLIADIPACNIQRQKSSFGPVERYNDKVGSELALHAGDIILEVENVVGNQRNLQGNLWAPGGKASFMLKTISEFQRVSFLVRRGGEEGSVATNISNDTLEQPPASHLGVTLSGAGNPAAGTSPQKTSKPAALPEEEDPIPGE